MAHPVHTLPAPIAMLTLDADAADWAEQHEPVPLPDDEYPHTDIHNVSDQRLWPADQ
jgi:hypothetical protein